MEFWTKLNTSEATGIPHRVMEDDVYQGMFIPKGATIVANARSVRHRSAYQFE